MAEDRTAGNDAHNIYLDNISTVSEYASDCDAAHCTFPVCCKILALKSYGDIKR